MVFNALDWLAVGGYLAVSVDRRNRGMRRMKSIRTWLAGVAAAAAAAGLAGCATPEAGGGRGVQRYGMITGIRPDKIAYYKDLHAKPWPGVTRMIRECHIRNFSIHLKEIEGRHYLFGYLEYAGRDFDADMARMAADPETQRWWKETDPCQLPLPDTAAKKKIWTPVEEVFHTDGAADLKSGQVRRIGTITGLKFEKEAWYRMLHQTPWPAVNDQIKACKIRNYSIYLGEIDGRLYLFSIFEYLGDDLAADGANMAKDPVTQRWWKQTDPCQIPLPAAAAKGQIWDDMEEVFFQE